MSKGEKKVVVTPVTQSEVYATTVNSEWSLRANSQRIYFNPISP